MLRGKLMLNLLLRQMDLNFQISWYGLWSTPSWEEGDRETSLLPVSEVPPYPATGLKRLPGFFVIKGDVINIYKGRRHCLCARPWGPMPHIKLLTHWYGQISTHGPDQLPFAKRWIDATNLGEGCIIYVWVVAGFFLIQNQKQIQMTIRWWHGLACLFCCWVVPQCLWSHI